MNRLLVWSFIFLAGQAMCVPSNALAFDCTLAKTITEKAVCKSPALMAKDRELNAAYRSALTSQSTAQAEQLKQAQRAWIKENDVACSGSEDCLNKRYQDRIAVLAQTAPTAKQVLGNGAIAFKTVTIKKTKPYELSLTYPKFEGSPAGEIAFLNAFVKQHLRDCAGFGKGGSGADSYIDETFEVRKLNEEVAVIGMSGETYCAGTAHPSHGSYDHFVSLKHKAEVNLFEGLSDAGKQALSERIAAAGQSIPAGDDCKESFSPDRLKDGFINFEYKDSRDLIVRPSLSHVEQACETAVDPTIAIADLEKYYAGQPAALAVLNGLKH